jgi:hypothetical protein
MDRAPVDSSPNLALLRKLRVDQAARWLEVHPFEVIRTLVYAEALPADLRLEDDDVERARVAGGIERWWEGATIPESEADLLRHLLLTVCDRLTADNGATTRCDNLFRGLERPRRYFLRRAVNEIVRMGYLEICMTTRGLSVTLPAGSSAALKRLADDPQQIAALLATLPPAGRDE